MVGSVKLSTGIICDQTVNPPDDRKRQLTVGALEKHADMEKLRVAPHVAGKTNVLITSCATRRHRLLPHPLDAGCCIPGIIVTSATPMTCLPAFFLWTRTRAHHNFGGLSNFFKILVCPIKFNHHSPPPLPPILSRRPVQQYSSPIRPKPPAETTPDDLPSPLSSHNLVYYVINGPYHGACTENGSVRNGQKDCPLSHITCTFPSVHMPF